jgi:hypothetical protein
MDPKMPGGKAGNFASQRLEIKNKGQIKEGESAQDSAKKLRLLKK